MRTQEIKLFDINELSEEAQSKAVEYLQGQNYFGADEREISEQFEEKLKEYGLPADNIEWSLGYCQGDGVAFYGDIDVEKLLKAIGEYGKYGYLVRRYTPDIVLTRNSYGYHYSHYNTMDIVEGVAGLEIRETDRTKWKELTDLIELRVRSVSRELEKKGYEIIEAHGEKDHIIEHAEINEMEFREDGRLWAG